VGSGYYVSSLSSEERNNIIAMLNLDMVGAGDILKIHTMGEYAKSLLADLAVISANKLNLKNERSAQGSSDHVPFESAGIPVAYLEYGPYEDYHTDNDTIDRVQREDLLNVCNVLINVCKVIGKNPDVFRK
jgi:aminopeptidase YwaD